ncbi:MAG: aldehyde dehydrogenase [Flavobacteriaceae bacterium]
MPELLKSQHDFFQSGKTKDVDFRKQLLKKLLQTIQRKENTICDALYKDFKKPTFESVATETAIIIKELKLAIKNISHWSKPKRVPASLLNFPSRDYIYSQPYGTALIIAPWNYPFQLVISPLIGAIAAGNTAVVKPSEHAPHTANILEEIINSVFQKNHVAIIQGGVDVSQELLYHKWDYVFFTGSVPVGRIVARAIAEHLTPSTLELGGKNPTIVDETAKVKLAAKRIVFGKFINAGQTCIAPDYVLVHEKNKTTFITALKTEIRRFYGNNPKSSKDFARIINQKQYKRLLSLIDQEKVVIGGEMDPEDNYISPTVILNPSLNSKIMQDEIFGPLLPVLVYQSEKDIDLILKKFPNPLSVYIFSTRKKFAEKLIQKYSFGGGTINDTLVHFINDKLPFGGVGNSGLGAYHGKHSFDTFTHKKSITKRANWLDIPLRYAPYKGKIKWLKRFF